MKLTLNGETRDVPVTTIGELVEHLGLTGQAVAVELNRDVVPKRRHSVTSLTEGDAIEIVTLVGGG